MNRLRNLYNSYNSINSKKLSIVLLCLFLFLIVVFISFHELTHDEAKAWLISRDASFYDLMFRIPHYEGHPPFWHLILASVSKMGIPYELGIKGVQIISAGILAAVFICLSPFNNVIKKLC